jgi:putative transposase
MVRIWNRFGPMFAAEIRRKRVNRMRAFTHWRRDLDEVNVKINGEMHFLWRAVDHEGKVLESFATKTRDKAAALAFMKEAGEASWLSQSHHHGWSALLQGCDDRARQRCQAGGRPLGQQQVENSHLPLPTTGAGDEQVQADEDLRKFSAVSRPPMGALPAQRRG